VGVQFHPEKSSAPGVAFVAAWVRTLLPAPALAGPAGRAAA
jgi:hypothetical protein